MFRFANPYYFFLLIPLGLAAWIVLAKRIKTAILFAPTHRVPHHHQSWRTIVSGAMPFLLLTGIGLTIIAIARPQTVLSKTTRKTNAIAIEMVVDASGSMKALDFSKSGKHQTRLDVVKKTFADFIKRRPDDLIGLVTFGGYATSRIPLTIDHSALLLALKGVHIPKQILDKQGKVINQEELLTAVGDALATACARLENTDIKSKIIVLLTDGESNTGIIKPEAAIKAAKALGIKVYTIGVGSNTRAPFMVRDIFGRNVIQYAQVRLDERLLRKIAGTTGGQYFNVKDPKGLARALRDIDKLEKTKIKKEVFHQYFELFPRFLWPGALLLVLAITVNVTISKRII